MDTNDGVYLRIQNTDGALFSTARSDWALVLADLEALGGVEFKDAVVASLTKPFAGVKVEVVAPAPAPVPVTVPASAPAPLPADEAALAAEAEAFLRQAAEPQDEPQQQFERCDVPNCGGVKDQWKPGGVSKNGKKYPGFWGCNNFRNHPR